MAYGYDSYLMNNGRGHILNDKESDELDQQRAVDLLQRMLEELENLQPSTDTAEYSAWRTKVQGTVTSIFGVEHSITATFVSTNFYFTPSMWNSEYMNAQESVRTFESGRKKVIGLLRGAIYEASELSANVADMDDLDPDLVDHVKLSVAQGRWENVVSQACIYFESTVRNWAGLPATDVGVVLVNNVFHPKSGIFRLGRSDGEAEGWHALARGVMLAVSNAARHRIEERPDNKTYSVGVLGTLSLILTQLKYQHANNFRTGHGD